MHDKEVKKLRIIKSRNLFLDNIISIKNDGMHRHCALFVHDDEDKNVYKFMRKEIREMRKNCDGKRISICIDIDYIYKKSYPPFVNEDGESKSYA